MLASFYVIASQYVGDKFDEGLVAQVMFVASAVYDPTEAKDLSELIEQLFKEAKASLGER